MKSVLEGSQVNIVNDRPGGFISPLKNHVGPQTSFQSLQFLKKVNKKNKDILLMEEIQLTSWYGSFFPIIYRVSEPSTVAPFLLQELFSKHSMHLSFVTGCRQNDSIDIQWSNHTWLGGFGLIF